MQAQITETAGEEHGYQKFAAPMLLMTMAMLVFIGLSILLVTDACAVESGAPSEDWNGWSGSPLTWAQHL